MRVLDGLITSIHARAILGTDDQKTADRFLEAEFPLSKEDRPTRVGRQGSPMPEANRLPMVHSSLSRQTKLRKSVSDAMTSRLE